MNIRSQAVEPSSVESETTMWNKVTEILVGLKRFGRRTQGLAIHFKDEHLVENHLSLALGTRGMCTPINCK